MFSKEYLGNLSVRTGFEPKNLQKQMTLLELLREIRKHPFLGKQFALKGGTAINLFWFQLPRLSIDIDLNYIGSVDRETMLKDRSTAEQDLKKLIHSRGISVEHAPTGHAGAKWRLRAPSGFGGHFMFEVDLNYIMRVPVWGIQVKEVYPLDEDYVFAFNSVSLEELFAGKINALLDRSAARDLYDVYTLSVSTAKYDATRLRKALILFGLTRKDDFRKTNFNTIDQISQRMLQEQLSPLQKRNEEIELDHMKSEVKELLAPILQYEENEQQFLDLFIDHGEYEPELLFDDAEQAQRLKHHPAVLWKLQNHRKYLGLEK
jgi:predicted nucleotidyltransferase component of viral defense system